MQKTDVKGYHLSMQQKRLWRQQGESQVWCTHCAVWLRGKLEFSSLLRALHDLVHRHDILRTAFRLMPGMEIPVQVVISHLEVRCPVIDVADLAIANLNAYLDERMAGLQSTLTHVDVHPLLAVE